MPKDECADCEAHYPAGKGLKDGLCKDCVAARKALKAEAVEAAEPEAESGEE